MSGRLAAARHSSALACALRLLLAVLLVVSSAGGVQVAFAHGGDGAWIVAQEGEGEGDSASESGDQPGSGSDPQPNVYVSDLGIYIKPAGVERIDVIAYATAPVAAAHQSIAEKGGSIDFDAVAFWNDGSQDYDWAHVTWAVEPGCEGIAAITRDTGVLTATGRENGTVTVTATLDAGYAVEPMDVQIAVDVTGQEDAPYVKSIVVCDDTGLPIDPSYIFHDVTLATALLELQAAVTVYDPVLDADTVYQVTPARGLSSLTAGVIADLTWYCAESSFGAVSEDGIYRPLVEATNIVYALSAAGADGSSVVGSATIIMPGEGEAHPQDSLTVDVVWEAYPDQVVASKTFSIADMEALGTRTLSYTAFGGMYGFMTFTGRGPYLTDVLAAAGVDVSGVAELRIESFDNPYAISWDLLVGKDRYYFPNMDIGSEAEAVQVAPMIALESLRAPLGTSDPVAAGDLTSDDRFRLLFGAGSGDEGFTTTSMQRYWIHTLHVVLSGAPPARDDEIPDEPEREERVASLVPGGGAGAAGGGGVNQGDPSPPSGSDGRSDADSRSGEDGRHVNAAAWSVLSAVNDNDSDVEGIDFDNPFGPFTGMLGVGALAAGGVVSFARFRWETRVPADLAQ